MEQSLNKNNQPCCEINQVEINRQLEKSLIDDNKFISQ